MRKTKHEPYFGFDEDEDEIHKFEALKQIVQQYVKVGWVEQVQQEKVKDLKCVGNVFLIPKKNDIPRLVFVNPALIEFAANNTYTMPNKFSPLYHTGKWFYKVDLSNAFMHINASPSW